MGDLLKRNRNNQVTKPVLKLLGHEFQMIFAAFVVPRTHGFGSPATFH
jgi:hypothetical protein